VELAGEVLFLWGKQMHYYKFNIADYRKDTTHLTPIEHYIYRSLIDWYYLDEHPIPKETQSVIRRLSLGSDMVNLVQNVLADFFDLTEKGYVHNRIEIDILEFHAKAGKNKENGKLGGRPAKPITTQNKTQSVNFDNPNQSEPNLNHKPITINHKLLTNIKPIRDKSLDDGFEEFWQAYPKKVGKDAAAKSWIKTKARIDDVLPALAWQKETDQWRRNDGQFIPNPATYLNQGRWQDEKPVIDMNPF
jgi:uncharacterized protein YdaU (DUF1376 family)